PPFRFVSNNDDRSKALELIDEDDAVTTHARYAVATIARRRAHLTILGARRRHARVGHGRVRRGHDASVAGRLTAARAARRARRRDARKTRAAVGSGPTGAAR